jgi:hypothetical protein
LIPIGLGVLLIAWVWPEQDSSGPGPLTVYYSRLLGVRFEGQGYDAGGIAGSIVGHLHWAVVAFLAFRPAARTGRLLVLGAAALFGLTEILVGARSLFHSDFLGISTALSVVGGALLVAGASVGAGRAKAPEIRETQEARP